MASPTPKSLFDPHSGFTADLPCEIPAPKMSNFEPCTGASQLAPRTGATPKTAQKVAGASPAGDPRNQVPRCLQAPRQECKRIAIADIHASLWHPCRGAIGKPDRPGVSFVDLRLPSVTPLESSGRVSPATSARLPPASPAPSLPATSAWATVRSRRRNLCAFPILLVLLTLLAACAPQSPTTSSAPERSVIASMQVSAEKADVHTAPSAASPVATTYPAGEQVSIYSQKDGWSEVSYGGPGSGWIRTDQLQSPSAVRAAPSGESSAGGIAKPSVRFLRPPDPVTNSHATGVIVLEGSVNSEGRIFEIRTVQNTTGSPELERQNREQLQKAVFAPVIVGGRPTPFVYDYRVQY
jgi:hypothetical protein